MALGAAGLAQEHIDSLIHAPEAALFKDPEIVDVVREYLGEGFPLYENAVFRCQDTLTKLVDSIQGLMSDSQLGEGQLTALLRAHPKVNGRYKFTRKLKFTLKKDELENQIYELNKSTKILTRLQGSSAMRQEVTVQSNSRTISKFASTLSAVRDYAYKLYSSIALKYTDNCHVEHEVRLYLSMRSSALEKTKSLKRSPIDFTVAFTPAIVSSERSTLLYKTSIAVLEDDHSPLDAVQPRGQSAVTISLPSPPSTPSPSSTEVDGLCQSIYRAYSTGLPLYLYLARSGGLRYLDIPEGSPLPPQILEEQPHDVVTLKDILRHSSHFDTVFLRFSLNQRMALSCQIASSILQLHLTPWLPVLTSNSICFARDAPVESTAGIPSPFIRRPFSACQGIGANCGHASKRSLLELGIILLELWHDSAIETFASQNYLDIHDNYGSRYEIAMTWLTQSQDHIMPFYMQLVTRCIECTFTTTSPTPDWKDAEFRKSICEYVLKPLWENCPVKYR